MNYGFVYILANASMPGMFKIGFTSKHPETRAKELSNSTSCATPFEVINYFGCREPQIIEHAIHQKLEKYRVNSARKFFQVDLLIIFEEIASAFDDFHGYEDENGEYKSIRADVLFDAFLRDLSVEKEWKINYFLDQQSDVGSWGKIGFE